MTGTTAELRELIAGEATTRGLRLDRWETGPRRCSWERRITYALVPSNTPRSDSSYRLPDATPLVRITNREGKTPRCRAYKQLTALLDQLRTM